MEKRLVSVDENYKFPKPLEDRLTAKVDGSGGDAVGGFVDAQRRITWLTHDRAGQPTEYAREAIGAPRWDNTALAGGFLDSDRRSTELVFDHAGRVPASSLNAWQGRMTPAPNATRTAYGHSLTAGRTAGATPWTSILAEKFGKTVVNKGSNGAYSAHVAAWQGGKHATVKVAGGVIPASGAVSVNINTNFMFGAVSTTQKASIAGIKGTIVKNTDNGSGADCTFTREAPGAATAVINGTPLILDNSFTALTDVVYLWPARNDITNGVPIAETIENVSRIIDHLDSVHRKVLIFEEVPYAAEVNGTPTRAALDTANDAIRAAFPAQWVPIASWLRTPAAAAAAGITFTAQDNTDIANGVTPASFRVDVIHLSTAGNTATAERIYLEELQRGWI